MATATVSTAEAQAAHDSLIDRMRAELAAQPKVEVKVHGTEDAFVQINGYTYVIQPGQKVKVPQSVAILLEEGGYI